MYDLLKMSTYLTSRRVLWKMCETYHMYRQEIGFGEVKKF